ncbi:MAG: ABC transporter substrate binding protein [Candidatus Auribacterota bacterium]
MYRNLTYFLCCGFAVLWGCTDPVTDRQNDSHENAALINPLAGKKVLYVDSYHPEYMHSKIVMHTTRKILTDQGIILKVIYLDAKRKKSDDQLTRAGLAAKQVIDEWKPDLVIAADDAASKYLIAPYYRNSSLPVVFVGINWDAEPYGYPQPNVTGQIEIEFVEGLICELLKYAKGDRIGIIMGNTLTQKKIFSHYTQKLHISFAQQAAVDTYAEWKQHYIQIQKHVDLLIVWNNAGIEGWDDNDAKSFIENNTVIPTGSFPIHMAPFVLMNYSNVSTEFGEYAAKTAIRILNGTLPSDIPLTKNAQLKVYLNMRLAKKLNIIFPMDLIRRSNFVQERHLEE